MTGPALDARFFETTRGRIVAALRRGAATVDELAAEMALSDNAIRTHLATLERDGFVRTERVRRGGGVGKPAALYEIHPDAEARFSRAYAPLLLAVLDELADRAPAELSAAAMRRVGRRLAQAMGLSAAKGSRTGARVALDVLAMLGGEAELEERGTHAVVQGCAACPLGAAVSAHPGLCRAVEALLTQATGWSVASACEHGARPRCRFEMDQAG